PISEVAGQNAGKVRKLIRRAHADQVFQISMLNLRGVSALNRNDRQLARSYFQQAYKINPKDAFTLNNMGYVAEMDGDRETAQYYYDKAQESRRADGRVDVATRKQAEGQRLGTVAEVSELQVGKQISQDAAQRRQKGPPKLLRREPTPTPESQAPESQPQAQPQSEESPQQ